MPNVLIKQNLCLQGETLIVNTDSFNLSSFHRIHVLAAGKGVIAMYEGLKTMLGEMIAGGVVVSAVDQSFGNGNILFCKGSHPIPDEASLQAGNQILNYVDESIGADDLVLFLLTGGASAMMVQPLPGLSLNDIALLNRLLIKSGANIREINCIRKHISALKGGRLAEKIYPASILTLIISDIVGSPLEDIGSGPTIGDSSTFEQSLHILNKYDLHSQLTPPLKQFFQAGKEKQAAETPEPEHPKFAENKSFVLGDISSLLHSVQTIAQDLGLAVQIITDSDQGDISDVVKYYVQHIKKNSDSISGSARPLLLVGGGEVTVKVKGKGLGGRNQQFILQVLQELADFNRPFCAMSFGSDGIDGPTDAAGAWIDHTTHAKALTMNISIKDYLDNNDSYHFFAQLDQLLKTGPTGTNVMDLRMFYLPGQ